MVGGGKRVARPQTKPGWVGTWVGNNDLIIIY